MIFDGKIHHLVFVDPGANGLIRHLQPDMIPLIIPEPPDAVRDIL